MWMKMTFGALEAYFYIAIQFESAWVEESIFTLRIYGLSETQLSLKLLDFVGGKISSSMKN